LQEQKEEKGEGEENC